MYSALFSRESALESAKFRSAKHKSNCSKLSGGLDEEDCKCLERSRFNFPLVASVKNESGNETAETFLRRRMNTHAM
jgi:2-oxo-4-hydroxy-4-carboxy--5-ureidoimidazoline (OHCU) decarboxylase